MRKSIVLVLLTLLCVAFGYRAFTTQDVVVVTFNGVMSGIYFTCIIYIITSNKD